MVSYLLGEEIFILRYLHFGLKFLSSDVWEIENADHLLDLVYWIKQEHLAEVASLYVRVLRAMEATGVEHTLAAKTIEAILCLLFGSFAVAVLEILLNAVLLFQSFKLLF